MSVVAPVRDELLNLEPLYRAVAEAFDAGVDAGGCDWELVLVDDGSRDGSRERIAELARADRRVVGVANDRGRGQTSALAAGFRAAQGELVAMLDADLQNDPRDLVAMIPLLERCDAVVGYRVRRQDTWIRRLSSRIGNGVRNRLTGDFVRDTGCSLKVFRAEAIRSVALFEGLHRFLPTLLRWYGWRVVEHPVAHHPRRRGRSKYGIGNRALRGLKDALAVRWMRSRIIPPGLGRSRLGAEADGPSDSPGPASEPARELIRAGARA